MGIRWVWPHRHIDVCQFRQCLVVGWDRNSGIDGVIVAVVNVKPFVLRYIHQTALININHWYLLPLHRHR
jgi:hypothetical protein